MRKILQSRGLRFIFTANMVSMVGSGMNSAAVTWYILQATHTEVALGTMIVMQTIPSMLLLPFTGVLIDREDRRRIVMLLDAGRGLIVLTVALLAIYGRVHVWQLYLMYVLVSIGFWMFWPSITALIQELTPGAEYVQSNTMMMAGFQGGWVLAGALVGFVYNHIGLGGVLLIDFMTYVVSFSCYLMVRKGRHVVERPQTPELAEIEGAVAKFVHELREGLHYLRGNRAVVLLGISWSLFLGAMISQGVVTAPLSDRILHAGAVGYGWLNGGWGSGAFLSAFYVPALIGAMTERRALVLGFAVLASCMFLVPHVPWLALAVLVYVFMGSARGIAGVAVSTGMMHLVPKHFMGRVQNTFYFAGLALQIFLAVLVGATAHRIGLAYAFALIATAYTLAFFAALMTKPAAARVEQLSEAAVE